MTAPTPPPSDASLDSDTSLDGALEGLVRQRFDRLIEAQPLLGTYLGMHDHDARLGDASREALDQQVADERRTLQALEALDPKRLSGEAQVERDLALHSIRRGLFDDEIHRVWERRVSAMETIGDGLFLLFARDFAPLEERLGSIIGRLEEAPQLMRQHQKRLGDRPMRLWNELELEATASLPALFSEIERAAAGRWADGSGSLRQLRAAIARTSAAIDEYATWIRDQLAHADDEFAIGREAYEELVALRAFDGLTTDQILEIGERQLAENHAARQEAARQYDASASEAQVLERIKRHHPRTFEDALEAYRTAMLRARQYVIDHQLATVPADERLEILPTPDYLRGVIPFAAYFQPAAFDRDRIGIYVVTPSVDDDPNAMLEHSYASISNTSIHEAYPGHHLQLSTAIRHPSLTRLLVDAPEFTEGWAMYCEQMMREQGFDATPEHLVILYTDAIWRACRIILDIKLHRGELSLQEAIEFLIEHTGFERPNATAEVKRYSYTPTYQMSYLLGKVLLLRLRDDERRRRGSDFSLRAFHDALLRNGSLPMSFHRRLLTTASETRRAC